MSMFLPGLILAAFVAWAVERLQQTRAGQLLLAGLAFGLGTTLVAILAQGAVTAFWGADGLGGPADRLLAPLLLLALILLQFLMRWPSLPNPRPWRELPPWPPGVIPFRDLAAIRRDAGPEPEIRGLAAHDPALALPIPGGDGAAVALAHPTGADGRPLGAGDRLPPSWYAPIPAEDPAPAAAARTMASAGARRAAVILVVCLGFTAITTAWLPVAEGWGDATVGWRRVSTALAGGAFAWLAVLLTASGVLIASLEGRRWLWSGLLVAAALLAGLAALALVALTA